MEQVICKTATADRSSSGGAAAMALRAACSRIEIQDYTHSNASRYDSGGVTTTPEAQFSAEILDANNVVVAPKFPLLS